MSAGQWGKARVANGGNIPLNTISQLAKPAFTVYEESHLVQASMTPQRQHQSQGSVLCTKKKAAEDHVALHCPVALFEPPDPMKKLMYCKEKVYQGTTELRFEEFIANRWKYKTAGKRGSWKFGQKEG